MGLPRSARLSRGDLGRAGAARRVRQASGPVSVQVMTVSARRGEPAPAVRVGFAISKAVGGAVVRNRVRRRLRVCVRRFLPQLCQVTSAGVTLVVVRVTPEAAAMRAVELDRHLGRAVQGCVAKLNPVRPPDHAVTP